MIASDPSGQYVVGDDAGRDRIFVWRLDTATGKLNEVSVTRALAGSAPRHFGFSPDGKTLYVADIDTVVGFDLKTGAETSRVKIPDAKFLNDLATGPDGAIYATDSFANRVWVVRNGSASLFSDDAKLELPNGILVDGNRVLVATDGRFGRGGDGTPGSLFAIDIATRVVTPLTRDAIGTPDGFESDGKGGFVLSDVGGGRIMRVSARGEATQVATLDRQPADIAFVQSRRLLVVPHTGLNRLSAYTLTLP